VGQVERRVLFEGILDVDFSIILKICRATSEKIHHKLQKYSAADRVLVDKDGMAAQFPVHISSAEPLFLPTERTRVS